MLEMFMKSLIRSSFVEEKVQPTNVQGRKLHDRILCFFACRPDPQAEQRDHGSDRAFRVIASRAGS